MKLTYALMTAFVLSAIAPAALAMPHHSSSCPEQFGTTCFTPPEGNGTPRAGSTVSGSSRHGR